MNSGEQIKSALNEIKENFRFLIQSLDIKKPPFQIVWRDKNGVFLISFSSDKKVKR